MRTGTRFGFFVVARRERGPAGHKTLFTIPPYDHLVHLQVRGLARSGDLSRMLPSEMALLAHGWPRKVQGSGAAAAAAAAQRAASAAAATTNGNGNGRGPTSSADRGSWRTAIANELQQVERQQQQQQGSGPQGQGHGQGPEEHHEVRVPVDASVSSGEYDLEVGRGYKGASAKLQS